CQIVDEPRRLRLGQPVGRDEGDVERAVAQARALEEPPMKLVELERLELDPRIQAGSAREIGQLAPDRALEGIKLPDCDSKSRHWAPPPHASGPHAPRSLRRTPATRAAWSPGWDRSSPSGSR